MVVVVVMVVVFVVDVAVVVVAVTEAIEFDTEKAVEFLLLVEKSIPRVTTSETTCVLMTPSVYLTEMFSGWNRRVVEEEALNFGDLLQMAGESRQPVVCIQDRLEPVSNMRLKV